LAAPADGGHAQPVLPGSFGANAMTPAASFAV